MEKVYLCKCNNCGTVMVDQNPQINAPKFTPPAQVAEMQFMKGLIEHTGTDMFWGCPVCETDAFLKDIETENDLK